MGGKDSVCTQDIRLVCSLVSVRKLFQHRSHSVEDDSLEHFVDDREECDATIASGHKGVPASALVTRNHNALLKASGNGLLGDDGIGNLAQPCLQSFTTELQEFRCDFIHPRGFITSQPGYDPI